MSHRLLQLIWSRDSSDFLNRCELYGTEGVIIIVVVVVVVVVLVGVGVGVGVGTRKCGRVEEW